MIVRMALPVMVLLAVAGCSGTNATAPMQQARGPQAKAAAATDADDNEGNGRSGVLQITKECSQYTRLAGSFCTITSSNLKQLPAGTRIVYENAAAAGVLETDVVLYPPGDGASVAFGHVSLNFAQAYGTGTISGGTGRFKHLEGSFEITRIPVPASWTWVGRYSFGETGDDD